jgi:hypothetical protein
MIARARKRSVVDAHVKIRVYHKGFCELCCGGLDILDMAVLEHCTGSDALLVHTGTEAVWQVLLLYCSCLLLHSYCLSLQDTAAAAPVAGPQTSQRMHLK